MDRVKKLTKEFEERENLKGFMESTVMQKSIVINKFIASLNGKPVLKTEEKDILKFLEWYDNLSAKTINRKISYLQEYFNFLILKQEILTNPALKIERRKVTEESFYGVFSECDIRRLLKVISNDLLGIRDRAIIELFYTTGIRLGELVSLNFDDIDLKENEIYVRYGKGDKERALPMGERASIALVKYTGLRYRFISLHNITDSLFLSSRGRRINPVSVRCRIAKWKKEAGITARGKTHALRHSCASHLLQNGAPIAVIKRLLGHEHLSTTEKYTHILKTGLKDIHKRTHPKAQEAE